MDRMDRISSLRDRLAENRTLFVDKPITAEFSEKCCEQIHRFQCENAEKAIMIIVQTADGFLYETFKLTSKIRESTAPIYTVAFGHNGITGVLICSSGKERFALSDSTFGLTITPNLFSDPLNQSIPGSWDVSQRVGELVTQLTVHTNQTRQAVLENLLTFRVFGDLYGSYRLTSEWAQKFGLIDGIGPDDVSKTFFDPFGNGN